MTSGQGLSMKMYDPSVRWLAICGAVFFTILGIKAMGSLISHNTQEASLAATEVPSGPLDTTAATPETNSAARPFDSQKESAADSGAVPSAPKPAISTTPDQRQAWLAVTNELGFTLVEGSPFERTATFVVKDADEANSRFSGVGRLRHKVPFADATFTGKVASTGAVTIQFEFESKPIVFDRFTPSGGLGQSVRGGLGIQPLNEYELEKYAEYDSLIASLVDATAGSLSIETFKFKERAAVLQQLRYRAVPAISARQLGYELAKPDRLIDGEIRAF